MERGGGERRGEVRKGEREGECERRRIAKWRRKVSKRGEKREGGKDKVARGEVGGGEGRGRMGGGREAREIWDYMTVQCVL